MTRPMSRVRRLEEYVRLVEQMTERLEEWYDAHPEASFGEIEEQARQERRLFMGKMLEVLINGRDAGFRFELPKCESCRQEMDFKDYHDWTVRGLEGDTRLERAYYVCPKCEGQTFFPLDSKLGLRQDHWSAGAARVATRHGLRAPSFRQAAEEYTDAVGGKISESSLRRLTLDSGEKIATWKEEESAQASALPKRGEECSARRVEATDPIPGRGNVSTDGTMIRIRDDGWREVKICAISAVEVAPPKPKQSDSIPESASGKTKRQSSRREGDPEVHLYDHSYCAGLWSADELAPYLYAEGLRRSLDTVEQLSSVNDGARWIERITLTLFPEAVQIVDWRHASNRLWTVGQTLFGEGSEKTKKWVGSCLDDLWEGKGQVIVDGLRHLDLERDSLPDEVRQAPGYFESNLSRMSYDQFRAQGYPIGSGTVESSCKNVVQHRMRRPGRGWTADNADLMLAGLGELHSGRFTWAWQQIHQSQVAGHPHF